MNRPSPQLTPDMQRDGRKHSKVISFVDARLYRYLRLLTSGAREAVRKFISGKGTVLTSVCSIVLFKEPPNRADTVVAAKTRGPSITKSRTPLSCVISSWLLLTSAYTPTLSADSLPLSLPVIGSTSPERQTTDCQRWPGVVCNRLPITREGIRAGWSGRYFTPAPLRMYRDR